MTAETRTEESQSLHSSPPTLTPGPNQGATTLAVKQSKRACDCCRKRKVRCDGADPCSQCKKAGLNCTYLQPPKKKGPKGFRSQTVIQVLRERGYSTCNSPSTPLSPQNVASNWTMARNGMAQMQQATRARYDRPTGATRGLSVNGEHFNTVPKQQQPHCDHRVPNSRAQQVLSLQTPPLLHQQQIWTLPQNESAPSASEDQRDIQSAILSAARHSHGRLIAGETFLLYVRLFFKHMFPIMPIIDHTRYLEPAFYADTAQMHPDVYCFLCALCAATIVQLDESISQPPSMHPTQRSEIFFAEECLRVRKTFDYTETSNTLGIMTSFFLFAYYGNQEQHPKAWRHLHESITSAEILELDVESSYCKLEPAEQQWRRRLYWLLFITERAYAIQRMKHTRLRATVSLPAALGNEDHQLLVGFVNLANLFSAVDDSFVSGMHRGSESERRTLCNREWLARTQSQLDSATEARCLAELVETHVLDIRVTRAWLHVLAWKLGFANCLIESNSEGGFRFDFPVQLAKRAVEATWNASAFALDSHGIGMEQKLHEIACCLVDVLRCTANDTSSTFLEGRQYLSYLLARLSNMRGKESRYLKSLKEHTQGLIGFDLDYDEMPLPDDGTNNTQPGKAPMPHSTYTGDLPTFPTTSSVGMLSMVSRTDSAGLPAISAPDEDWQQRAPHARVVEGQGEMYSLHPWFMDETTRHM